MIVNKPNQTNLSGFYIIYNGSTNLEKKGWFGLSHLMEHLKCKCIDDLMDDFQEDAIQWNAYTGNNRIVFYFTGLERCLAKYRDIIIERFYLPFEDYVSKEDLEKEIRIVSSEYNQSFTSQEETFYLNHFRRNYSCYSPIGLKEDIENTTYEDCLEFYDLQYKNPDMIINISKDFKYVNDDIQFNDRKNVLKRDWVKNDTIDIETPITKDETLCVLYEQEVEEEDVPILKLISSMLTSGLNSPLVKEIRENRGLCYAISNYTYQIGKLPIMMIDVITAPENCEELDAGLREILHNKEKYMTSERLEVVRNGRLIKKEIGEINAHNSISIIVDENLQKLHDILEDITLEEIHTVYDKYFRLDKFNLITDRDIS